MQHPSSPRQRVQAAVGLSVAAGLAATGITVAFAEDEPVATDAQVAEVRGAMTDLDREVDRIEAVHEYVELVAAREYSIAVYARALDWQAAADYAEAQAAEASSSGVGGHLAAIRACESGGDYGAISSSGTYRGAYQFDYATWQAVGGSGDPAAASPAEQDMRAQMLYDQSGSSPWPVCGS